MNLQITDVPLPVRMSFDKPLTDDELLRFSAGNEVVWIEREADGTLYVKPIADTLTGSRCADVNADLGLWDRANGRGRALGGTGYLLPDGSMRGASVSWIARDRLDALSPKERKGFVPFAPDFVVEVLSAFDDPAYLRRKMDQWIANGVQVAWLIEADKRRVTVYRVGREAEVLEGPEVVRGDGVVNGFELSMAAIWD